MDNNNLKKQNRLMKKPVPKTPEERSETEEIILDNFLRMLFLIGLHGAYSFRPDERKGG